MIRSFSHSEFPVEALLSAKRRSVSVVLPAREVADTIGAIVERIYGLDGLVDQVLVVDAASEDGTEEVARAAGAEVLQEADLLPQFGQVLGKGDAMWRALVAVRGELVVYLDADTRDFSAHFVTGMLGPLIAANGVEFVKGAFERPFLTPDGMLPRSGGRVTELAARPLLSAFYPELAAFRQPLAGEVAAPRSVFERLPFRTGYAIETAMLLDARELVGVEAMAQVDLEERRNRHQPLEDLGPMAYAVLDAVCDRLRREGRLAPESMPPFQAPDGRLIEVQSLERPPLASIRSAA